MARANIIDVGRPCGLCSGDGWIALTVRAAVSPALHPDELRPCAGCQR